MATPQNYSFPTSLLLAELRTLTDRIAAADAGEDLRGRASRTARTACGNMSRCPMKPPCLPPTEKGWQVDA